MINSETIEVARLDSVMTREAIDPPALLKIDTQGYELEVIRGCGDLLAAFECVYAELSYIKFYDGQPLADDVLTAMRDNDFHISGVFNQAVDGNGKALQADFLFTRNT